MRAWASKVDFFFSNNLNCFFPNENLTLGVGGRRQNGMSRFSREMSVDQTVNWFLKSKERNTPCRNAELNVRRNSPMCRPSAPGVGWGQGPPPSLHCNPRNNIWHFKQYHIVFWQFFLNLKNKSNRYLLEEIGKCQCQKKKNYPSVHSPE